MRNVAVSSFALVCPLVFAGVVACGNADPAWSGEDTSSQSLELASSLGVELVATGAMAGDARSGLLLEPAVLEDGTPHDVIGGWGSAVAYTGIGNRFLATPDRGPADGTTSILDRAYVFELSVAGSDVSIALASAVPLVNELGENFTGSTAAFDATNSPASRRFDPEGVCLSGTGSYFVSDEYGPFLYEFDASGRRKRALPLPEKFLIDTPAALAAGELPPGNVKGRQANRGMEGLSISPDRSKLFGVLQNPLIQDGALDAANKRVGLNTRIVETDVVTGATRELLYVLDAKTAGLNEILAVNAHQFLVIERDGNAGTAAAAKRIYLVDLAGATDISGVASLPTSGVPAGIVAVQKTPFIDLLDPAFGLAGATFPEKLEGLAFGPDLADGRRLLFVVTDNDFIQTSPTRIFAFAIPAAALPGFEWPVLTPRFDVLPLDARNTMPLALARVGVPVALFGSPLFDVTAVDLESLRVSGAPVRETHAGPLCAVLDLDRDGSPDLTCVIDGTKLPLGHAPRTLALTLAATTTTGTPVQGRDSLTVRRP